MKSQDNLVAAASSDGTVTFYDRTSGVDCMQVNLVLDKRDAHITCVCFDHAEEVLIVGDNCGKIRCYDIKQNFSTSILRVNSDDKAPPPQLSRVISAFKAHDYVVSMTWIERNKLILSSGQVGQKIHLIPDMRISPLPRRG
jgi:WD40 repeat protein